MMKDTLRFEDDDKHSIMYYVCLTLPPVLIILLPLAPPDFGSAIFWLAGGAYAVKSLLKLMYLLLFNIDHHRFQVGRWKERAKMFSEATVVTLFLLAIFSVKLSWEAAKKFTLKTAEQLQEECKRSACPDAIEGWTKSKNIYFIFTGKCAKYRLSYIPSEELDTYRLVLRQDMDRDFVAEGGRDTEITVKNYPLPYPDNTPNNNW